MRLSFMQSSQLKTVFSGLILLSLAVGFLCISSVHAAPVHASMDMTTHVHEAHATSLNNCCDTSTSDHMELWKSTLVGIPQGFQDLLVLVGLAVASSFAFSDFFRVPRFDTTFFAMRFRQYAREHPDIPIYDSLRLAFARGILHPKTY